MTYSILVFDPAKNQFGAAAATGSLCVGGWVIRGNPRAGLVASQGALPSTIWRDGALEMLRNGNNAQDVVNAVVADDQGKEARQLAVLDRSGNGCCFTGDQNTFEAYDVLFENGIAAGNLLANKAVLPAMVEAYKDTNGSMSERLLMALSAARDAGSDKRGLLSAALLVVSSHEAPLDLRVDYGERPLEDLKVLRDKAFDGEYHDWRLTVPTLDAPERNL